jgi:hypothetical protein
LPDALLTHPLFTGTQSYANICTLFNLPNEQVKEGTVDFIERIFGIAPDNGSGSLEFLLFLIPLAGLALLLKYRRASRKQERPKQ